MALVDLSVVEQRYRAVMAVLAGGSVTEVAARFGVSRQSVHAWVTRYRRDGMGGLVDRSHRPAACPHQTATDVEVVVFEMRRAHPGWGALRIRLELARLVSSPDPMPSRASVNRILLRHGLVVPGARRRKRSDYVRWQRPEPMQLWQIDIVGGLMLVDAETGELREAKIVTGVDDHSRFCVIAKGLERATGRAVCLALSEALVRFGVPEEILTDNGKQFTDRFGNSGEVLFDKICRRNAIAHRLTRPKSPTTTGKVERFHQTLRREFLDHAGPYTSLREAQAALDSWVDSYNAERPHQSRERGGSGIISCNNNDGAAENTWRTRTEAGVGRHLVVHWNVIPYYLGTDTKIRAWKPGDIANAGPMLAELVALLPDLRSVILGGEAAKTG